MTALPILLFWTLAFWGFAGRGGHRLLYLYFPALSFGSFAVLPTAMTAGLTFTPAPIVGLLIVARCLFARRGLDALLTCALRPRRLLLLTLFWVVAVLVTAFMPRILTGRVDIIPFRGEMLGPSPLYPSAQNISQLSYLTISVFAAIAFATLLRDPGMRQHGLRAICLGAAVAVATGLLDHASTYAPVTPLLEPFRTASYALLVSHSVLGGKRVVGLMPEASAYGLLCLSLLAMLYFFRRSIADRRLRERYAPLLLGLLALCVWLSTSSAAYVGLMLFGLVAATEWGWRAVALRPGARARRGLSAELWLACSALAALMLVILLAPRLLDPVVSMFDTMVLQKTSSDSFAERNMWTATSWRATLASWGLGVGVGSTRASSSVVGVVSGTGFLGALLYFGFVVQTMARTARPHDAEGARLLSAVRWSFLPPFANSLLIGISADFGPVFAFLYGLAAAVAFSLAPDGACPPVRRGLPAGPTPRTILHDTGSG